MTMLPSGGARFIEQGGGSAPRVSLIPVVQTSAGNFEFVPGGVATHEWVDLLGDGNYTIVALGTSPTARRARGHLIGASGPNVMVY